jgi:hypothetical protein
MRDAFAICWAVAEPPSSANAATTAANFSLPNSAAETRRVSEVSPMVGIAYTVMRKAFSLTLDTAVGVNLFRRIRSRRAGQRRYLRRMGANQSSGRRVQPIRRLQELDGWTGMWVAIKDGAVIAAAPTSRELVVQVRSKGELAKGAVAQFVPTPSDEIVIGVG